MKQLIYVYVGLLLWLPAAAAQRLPEIAAPDHYQLSFNPDFTKDNFSGEETIQIRVLKPTTQIVLNAAEIEFQDVTVASGATTQNAKVNSDKDLETATLAFEKEIPPGPATLHIRYTGILNGDMRGFYLGKDSTGRKYAATQLEATDARRAFPSFDEPAYKATFDITVVADRDLTVIANTKALSDVAGPEGKHTVHFATTPKMSAYLVAMVVGHFDYIEGSADGIPIRVYASPEKKELGRFALEAAESIMHYFNQYFGIKYPYGKLDLVGLSDFSAGAMENTGCITFREVILLIDEQHGSVGLKKTIANVIAHEMAHQWFGDLVTMKWWDDVWLNEGFATWMESKPVEAWKPEWHVDLDDVSATTNALSLDGLNNTRPIHQQAETKAEIQELFDGIAYGKAASVLHMLETYLGEQTFRAGVNLYLNDHQYANATAGDFWKALAKASHKPVDQIMPTFITQAGAPLVNVKAQCSGGSTRVTLTQQRYFADRTKLDAPNDQLWQIPVCLRGSGSGPGTAKCQLLTRKEESFTLPGCPAWVLANPGPGYYRAGYDPAAVKAMAADAETKLSPAERIALQSDTWASVYVGREPVGDYLAFAQGVQSDRNRAVVEDVLRRLHFIERYLVNDSDRDAYRAWLRQYLGPMVKEVGLQSRPGDSDEQKELRARLLGAIGYDGRDPEALAAARKITEQGLRDSASVDRELGFAAFALAALNGDSAFYDQVMAAMKNPKSPEEYYLYFFTLPEFGEPALLQRTLDYAISPDVRSQDSLQLISGVLRNPLGEKLAWSFVQAHWDAVEKAGGPFASAEVVDATGSFCDAGMRDEVKAFFMAHPVPAAERGLKQSLERINDCVDLKSQQQPQLAWWLQQQQSSAAGN